MLGSMFIVACPANIFVAVCAVTFCICSFANFVVICLLTAMALPQPAVIPWILGSGMKLTAVNSGVGPYINILTFTDFA